MARKSKKSQPGDQNVPISGSEAYTGGFTAADCPYAEDDPAFEVWNADWDAAADAASAEYAGAKATATTENGADADDEPADEEKAPASVVKEEYRARYAEMGHPAHCGDELAVLLNNLCLTKAGIDLPRFEHICMANGVDLSKYNRTSKGWQGRLRMTGRNMLAGKVYEAGGVVKTTYEHSDEHGDSGLQMLEGAEAEYRLSAEWMTSRRKVKEPVAETVEQAADFDGDADRAEA